MHFIGIDLSWKSNGYSGVCILDEHQQMKYWEVGQFTNKELWDRIKNHSSSGVTISVDAPLSVKNKTGSRASENEFKKTPINGQFLSIFSTNRNFMLKSFGEIRGEDLLRMIIENPTFSSTEMTNNKIFETFPTGIAVAAFSKKIKYKVSNGKRKAVILQGLTELQEAMQLHPWFSKMADATDPIFRAIQNTAPTLKTLKLLDDKIDALLCAYCAWKYYNTPDEVYQFGTGYEALIINKN